MSAAGRSAAAALLAAGPPRERIAALADPGSVAPVNAELEAPRPSPHLARWSIAPQDDDGIVTARARIHGAPVLIAAQDPGFLRGAVGAGHAAALRELFRVALAERPEAVLLLCASGGVRLHEATPAEVELARALSLLLDVRAAATPVLAVGVGDVFGGASVLACAADRLVMLPGTRLGVSGPKVIAASGSEPALHPNDPAQAAKIFGAEARSAAGQIDLVADDVPAIRAWITAARRAALPLVEALTVRHASLGRASTERPRPPDALPAAWRPQVSPVDPVSGVWKVRDTPAWVIAPRGADTPGPSELHALDTALLSHVLPRAHGDTTLILVEDSGGHEASIRAEELCIARYLAHHAAVLSLLRHAGMHLVGVLAGLGHSAAFFTNALQAQHLYALRGARVIAMAPQAVARVTGLAAADLQAYLDRDPALGHSTVTLAHWGALAGGFDRLDAESLQVLLRPH